MRERLTSGSIFQLLRAFQEDRKGSLATFFALAAIPLFGFAGASVDYSRALASKTAMQGAADGYRPRTGQANRGRIEWPASSVHLLRNFHAP